MNEIVNAEYRIDQERTLPVIASEILQIERDVYATAMNGAIQIGRKLQEAKELVGYGEWENWCKENLNYSKRNAENFMRIATEYGNENSAYAKTQTSAELSISKALELLKVPEEQVETFVEEHKIEDISVRELREEIKKLQSENKDLAEKKDIAVETAAKAEAEHAKLTNAKLEAQVQVEEYAKCIEELREQLKEAKEKPAEDSDNEEIERLKMELKEAQEDFETASETLEETAKKLKEEKAKAKEKAEKNYERGEAAGRQEAQESIDKLKAQNDELQKKLANSADQSKVKLGILTNQLQITFNEIIGVVNEMNGEDASNASNALRSILSALSKRLQP